MLKEPVKGLMASAWAQASLAAVASKVRTSLPGTLSLQPLMTGEVKSEAGVRVE